MVVSVDRGVGMLLPAMRAESLSVMKGLEESTNRHPVSALMRVLALAKIKPPSGILQKFRRPDRSVLWEMKDCMVSATEGE